jgi:histidinol-phosphate phosphatase family protein
LSLVQAVILAGGQGTRLKERLGDLPKPLIDVAGTPLLERQILLLKRYGYQCIIILVNYQADKIEQFCKAHAQWGLNIRCVDDGEPRGTAGAVLNIFDQLDEEFLVVYGDTMLEVDLARFATAHAQHSDGAGTIFLHPNDHPQDSDLVELNAEGCVTAFHPYPHQKGRFLPNLVNAALYILRRDGIEPWQHKTPAGIFDFGKNLFPELLARGSKLYGYNSPEYIKDCGTPSRLDKITQHLLSGKIDRSSLSHPQPTVFIDRDGTLNHEVDHLRHHEQLVLFEDVQEAMRRLNQSDYRTCIVTNQPVVARGECSLDELKNIHNKLETLLGEQGAYVDRIYACPHHPDKGFAGEVVALKIKCDCRKPGTALVAQAVAELNSDLSQSWFIGDTTTDVETARRAGLISILVETGYAGLDHKYLCTADFTVPDFSSAVRFILDVFPQSLQSAQELLRNVAPGALILVGGQARSGKTTAAGIFKMALQAKGKRAHVVSTDQWLLSAPDRKAGVFGRHDMQGLQQTFEALTTQRAEMISIGLPAYLKKTRTRVPDAKQLEVSPSDIVIIEGVVALSLQAEQTKHIHHFAISLPEPLRRERFMAEYIKRSGNVQEAEALYSQRMDDEYDTVQTYQERAQLIPSFTDRGTTQALT